jgi:hypothetical protein
LEFSVTPCGHPTAKAGNALYEFKSILIAKFKSKYLYCDCLLRSAGLRDGKGRANEISTVKNEIELKNLHIDNRYFTFNKKSKWALSKPNK